MYNAPPSPITVWDLQTRIGHWSLIVFFFLGYFSGEDEGLLFRIHVYTGYIILLIVLFRIAWGFAGSDHARFADFVCSWREVKAHLTSALRFSPRRWVGHNPTGGWMILAMLVTLMLTVLTGMIGAGAEGAYISFFHATPRSIAKASKEIHEGLANVMMILVIVHVLGVLAESLLTRENLIGSMISGRKKPANGGHDIRSAPLWRTIVLIAALAFLGGALVAQTRF
jgi:cytochrome b